MSLPYPLPSHDVAGYIAEAKALTADEATARALLLDWLGDRGGPYYRHTIRASDAAVKRAFTGRALARALGIDPR